MIRNYDEVLNTIEALNFYINRGDKSIKEFRMKADNLEKLVGIARERLRIFEDAPKKEELDEIK